MKTLRKSKDRGYFDHGWLKTRHTFSFGRYVDRSHMGFRVLRVINEDYIAAGEGFGTHPHDNMEILTYVVSGELEHRDSMGNGSVIPAGEFQHMTAGSGITHSEFNPSPNQEAHIYQIWILPESQGLTPSYAQRSRDELLTNEGLALVASPDGRDNSIRIRQDVRLYQALLSPNQELQLPVDPNRYAWIQVVSGALTISQTDESDSDALLLESGDGVAIEQESQLLVKAGEDSEIMFFDLP